MPDVAEIISASMDSAGIGGDNDSGGSDTTESPGSTGTADTQAAESQGAPSGEATPAGDPAPTVEGSEGEPPVAAAPKQRQGPIPLGKHKEILENERTKHATELKALQAKYAEFDKYPDAANRIQAIELSRQNPELFAQVILQDPQFGSIFRRLLGKDKTIAPADAGGPAPEAFPEPDGQDEHGNATYTLAGLKAVLKYTEEQAFNRATEFVKSQFDERLKDVEPIVAERKHVAALRGAYDEQGKQLAEARKWPGFNENFEAVKTYMLEHKLHSLEGLTQAYMAVVVPLLTQARDAQRADIIKELQGRPRVAAPAPRANGTPGAGAKRSIEDIIREKTNELESVM